jgi:hypothetical protein
MRNIAGKIHGETYQGRNVIPHFLFE